MKEFCLPREKTASGKQHKLSLHDCKHHCCCYVGMFPMMIHNKAINSMCLKIHKIPTVLLIDENTASKEFSFTDFFSKNSNRINDQGAIMEILHVLDKCDRSNWSAVLKTILSCKSIFSITKLFLVSKLSWRSGRLTRGSCMAIICLSYSHFYHAVDFYSTYISCSPLRWHFYHGFRGVFYRVDGCLLPGWWRVFLKDARVFTLQARGKNIQDDFLATRMDFWRADFDQRWLDMKRLQGHALLCEEGERAGEKCLARIKKKNLQRTPPGPENSKCPPLLITYLILTLPSPP